MDIDEEMRRHAKDMGLGDLMDSLHRQSEKEPKEKLSTNEAKHRQMRKRKDKVVKASRKRNR